MSRLAGATDPALAVLRLPVPRRLFAAQALSVSGDWLYGAALIIVIYRTTHSAGWLAVSTVVRMLPYVLISPFSGELADRVNRRRLMIAGDAIRASIMGGLTVAVAAGAGPVVLVTLASASVVVSTTYSPAMAGTIPSVVPKDQLTAANSVVSAIHSLAWMLGPAAGSLIVLFGSPPAAFAVNAATFVGSGLLVLSTPTEPALWAAEKAEHPAPKDRYFRRLAGGATAVVTDRQRAILVSFYVGLSSIYGVQTVVLVLASDRLLHTGSAGVGWLLASAGVGGLVAAVFTGRLGPTATNRILAVALVGAGLPTALLALVPRWPAYVLLAVDGACNVVIDVLVVSGLQMSVPEELRSRVYAFMESAGVVGILAGAWLAAVLVHVGLTTALVVGGGLLPALVVLLAPAWGRLDRSLASRATPAIQVVPDVV